MEYAIALMEQDRQPWDINNLLEVAEKIDYSLSKGIPLKKKATPKPELLEE